jgi:hypothetical protein
MEQGDSGSDSDSSDTDADGDGDALGDEEEQESLEPEPGAEERETPNNPGFTFNDCETPVPPHPVHQRPETLTTEHTYGNAASNVEETNYHDLMTQYLVPFFNYKLAHRSGRYSIADLKVEITGFVLESLRGWFAEVRRDGNLEAKPSPGENKPNARCSRHHLGTWMKSFYTEVCEACHRHQPLYTLTCPGCGQKACVSCRFQMRVV